MAAILPIFTVRNAMVLCGINDVDVWQQQTAAERIAHEVFGDNFAMSMHKTTEELGYDFTHYAKLTVANGRIILSPLIKRNVKAFIQWCRDEIRMGRDPSIVPFPVNQAFSLIEKMSRHDKYVANSKTLSDQAKPKDFTNEVLWEDWEPTFMSYLRTIPGQNGVPLAYVVRANIAPNPTPQPDFLDEYILMAPLHGVAYTADSLTVLMLLNNLIVGNEAAEGAVKAVNTTTDGRAAVFAVKHHYEGQGMMQMKVTKAEDTITDLFYSGEKPPHMWWTKFETELTKAFATIDNRAGRIVYDDEQKLRKLQRKIKADFLKDNKAAIEARIAETPMTMTYKTALNTYCNAVQNKYPHGNQRQVSRRGISETSRGRGNGNNNNNSHGGHGRGGGGRGANRYDRRANGNGGGPRNHPDQETIILSNNQRMKYHPSYRFRSQEMQLMTQSQRDRLRSERASWRERQGLPPRRNRQDRDAEVAELRSQVASLHSMMRGREEQDGVTSRVAGGQQSQVSQISAGSSGRSIMGGRNSRSRREQSPSR